MSIATLLEGFKSNSIEGLKDTKIKDVILEKDLAENIDYTTQLDEGVKAQCSDEGIDKIRDKYENVDNVLENIKENFDKSKSEIDLQKQINRIEKYKGVVFEKICIESLQNKFNGIELKQLIIDTSEGKTKPDIVLRDAIEDLNLDGVEIEKGEDLFAEVKCGTADYIGSEMEHIQKQVLGHEGNSVVIVTKDYLDIDPQKRIEFENKLSEMNSKVIVVDVYSTEVSSAVVGNIVK